MNAGWTEERIALLRKLNAEGLSCSQIANELGGGVSRNAVIGKLHRLGLSAGARKAPSPNPTPKPRRRLYLSGFAREANPTVILGFNELTPEVASNPRTLSELRADDCRWPIGDPSSPDFAFCGFITVPGYPYCAQHCRVAYVPLERRRAAA